MFTGRTEWLRYDWSDHVNQQQYQSSNTAHHEIKLSTTIIITFLTQIFSRIVTKCQPRPKGSQPEIKNILTFWNFWLFFSLFDKFYYLAWTFSSDNVGEFLWQIRPLYCNDFMSVLSSISYFDPSLWSNTTPWWESGINLLPPLYSV